jgi:hypothetical protein
VETALRPEPADLREVGLSDPDQAFLGGHIGIGGERVRKTIADPIPGPLAMQNITRQPGDRVCDFF